MASKTVAAIATPAGDGALGVIRISGEKAIETADRVFFAFSGKKLCELSGYTAAYGEIKDGDTVLDDGVALVFKAPHSFTGEDTVEISVHGGGLMLISVLRLITANGASLALPGEFSKRAFLNGKTDLTKAESIMGLVSARSEAELKLSRQAHTGRIFKEAEAIEKNLVSIDASISAFSDYPDEDIEGLSVENFTVMLKSAGKSLENMLSTFDAGKILREGIATAIVGKPNVGKSTLMNLLTGTERSIVTDVAGTTRDIVEETVALGDITLILADTAGIHTTEDTIESIGVMKARERIASSQLVLAVFDGSKPLCKDDFEILSCLDIENTVAVINKADLQINTDISAFKDYKTVLISAKTGSGCEELKNAVAELTHTEMLTSDSIVLINERQRDCAVRALDGINEALNALNMGCTMDAVGVCVDDALAAMLEMTGKRVTNEVTDEIFRKFCVGK